MSTTEKYGNVSISVESSVYIAEVLACILPIEGDLAKRLLPDSDDIVPFAITVLLAIIISCGNFH